MFSSMLCIIPCLAIAIAMVHGQPAYLAPRTVQLTESDLGRVVGAVGGSAFRKIQTKDNVTRWTQTVNDIPVYGSVLTTHGDEQGNINQMQGFVSQTVGRVDTVPAISGEQAVVTLRSEWGHADGTNLNIRVDESELHILQTEDGFDRLVYKVSYFVDHVDQLPQTVIDSLPGNVTLPALITGLVNAHTGEIERSWNDIQFKKVWGITGNRNTNAKYHLMDVEEAGPWDCRHRDLSKKIVVYDYLNKRAWTADATTDKFQCRRAGAWNWDRFDRTGAYSPRNEAFVNANKFFQLWSEVVGDQIPPYQTNTSFLAFSTHYGNNFENAFFDGVSFFFGDGHNNFYPMMTLDVLCHEVGHSVTAWNGGAMEYRSESGGMNEAYSDILGETCDMHFNRKNDFLIAKEVMRPGNTWGIAWRSMCDPPSIGGALDHYSQFNNNVGVHYSSGIYNKAWCTLTKTRGWDYLKAFEVFTNANLMYWHRTSTMHCGACGVEAAAADKGLSKADVTAAFNVVGVSCSLCR